ncbi:hypothetical protein Poli38472_009754 [Pythium oligandrum]|uniref:Uncharacterized protein n=1 Tax=Pythium oligandrum TaxID=41045 RepID=A0A8K1CG81_PYTOL|nr:hypothetical protein Poli38472_009754 [Pythium oligandrum]|eukprot:TMW62261.1 hypothetical protein Poli38472_009754 [Pythium oligandrum]
MKALEIKNFSDSKLFFAFTTTSNCKCAICQTWTEQETHPIAGMRDATYGYIQVEPFSERTERFCDNWQCLGACCFDSIPEIMEKDMLTRFIEDKDYKVDNGRAIFCFTSTTDASLVQPTYVHIENYGYAPLFFVFSVVSKCDCTVCLQWMERESVRTTDSQGTTYGYFEIDGLGQRVERICGQWNCIGACFFETMPEVVERAMLLPFHKHKGYKYGKDRAKVHFTDHPEVSSPDTPGDLNCIHIENLSASTLYFAFCTTSRCECDVCLTWLKHEKIPFVNVGNATYGYFRVDGFSQRVDHFCGQWTFDGACVFNESPDAMAREMLLGFESHKTYLFANLAKVHCVRVPEPSKYVHIENVSNKSTLYFAFATLSKCRCQFCQRWVQLEEHPLVDAGWRVGRFVLEPNKVHSVRACPDWECVGACFVDKWPSELKKLQFGRFDRTQDFTVAGGKAKLGFQYSENSSLVTKTNEWGETEIVATKMLAKFGYEAVKLVLAVDGSSVVQVVSAAASCAIS